MTYAEDVVLKILSSTGGSWATKAQILDYLEKNGGSFEDFMKQSDELFVYEDCFTTKYFADLEDKVACGILRIMQCGEKKSYDEKEIRRLVKEFDKADGMQLHPTQVDAVVKVVTNAVCLLIGGPGTGKTTVTKRIIQVKRALNPGGAITLTAPTGKAANRMAEATEENACTLHKKVLKGLPLYEDCIFIDESSMIDLELAAALFTQLKDGAECVLIGDTEQLPSVGAGAVLRDLIASGVVPVARLTKTFRQDGNSRLADAIKNLKDGIPKIPSGDDIHPVEIENSLSQGKASNMALKEGLDAYKKAIKKYGIENVAFLIPYRKNGFCSDALNPMLQRIANNKKYGFKNGGTFFSEGDLILQLENRTECANGDVGRVTSCDKDGITVLYAGGEVHYDPSEMEQISLAYSMSIHKSQGSEYAHVICVMLNQHEAMLQRNLIYTGVTRAKKECTVIYQKSALETAMKTKSDANRKTFLAEKMQYVYEMYRNVG